MQPFISICIPAYKNEFHLKRLIESIRIQTFKDYEIIISDDTPDDSIEAYVHTISDLLPVKYHHNSPSFGTPKNWNEAIKLAQGKWIKLMHNDDWFADENALQVFCDYAKANESSYFLFSAFCNITEDTDEKETVRCNFFDRLFLRMSPLHLFKRVYVGNPSCTLVRKNIDLFYDERFKFVVDFDYYITCFRKNSNYTYIDKVLINVGFHSEQVTKYTFGIPEVQVPENIILLEKLGTKILKNPVVFDYYWRLMRNLKIRDVAALQQYYSGEIPNIIKRIVQRQSKINPAVLQKGLYSKLLMTSCYISNLFKGIN